MAAMTSRRSMRPAISPWLCTVTSRLQKEAAPTRAMSS